MGHCLENFLLTSVLLTALYTSYYNTIVWVFIIPPLLLSEKKAHDWVWAAVQGPLAGVCVGFGPMHQSLNQKKKSKRILTKDVESN